jgi:hypothetical protein
VSNGKPTEPMFYSCRTCGIGWVSIYGFVCWTCREKTMLKVDTPRRLPFDWMIVVLAIVAVIGIVVFYFCPEAFKL